MVFPESDQFSRELKEALTVVVPVPVKPVELVVLAIGIVVAMLRPAELVSAQDHRHALRNKNSSHQVATLSSVRLAEGVAMILGGDEFRKKNSGHQVATLTSAKPVHRQVVRWPFLAAIPGVVVVVPVPVFFAVRFVVLFVVRDQVVQSESVVCRDIVDACERSFALVLVEVGAPGQPIRELRHRVVVSLPVAS